jgi:death-on-curing protein
VIFITLDDICEINRIWLERYGGRYVAENRNFSNKASLEYILAAIQFPLFGVERFPTLIDKAAALAWWITEGHVFVDGNKRTGMQAAIALLEINGARTYFDMDFLIETSLAIATGQISVEELSNLFSSCVQI